MPHVHYTSRSVRDAPIDVICMPAPGELPGGVVAGAAVPWRCGLLVAGRGAVAVASRRSARRRRPAWRRSRTCCTRPGSRAAAGAAVRPHPRRTPPDPRRPGAHLRVAVHVRPVALEPLAPAGRVGDQRRRPDLRCACRRARAPRARARRCRSVRTRSDGRGRSSPGCARPTAADRAIGTRARPLPPKSNHPIPAPWPRREAAPGRAAPSPSGPARSDCTGTAAPSGSRPQRPAGPNRESGRR